MLEMKKILYEGRFRLYLLGAFVLIGLLAGIDVIADVRGGTHLTHIAVEILVFTIATSSAFLIYFHLHKEAIEARQLISELTTDLQKNRQEAIEWKNETQTLLQGLGASINNQFERWKLTPSEKEIGLFLLKGLSHKEVAYARGVSEATARQQAGAVYKKAGLLGRHDLAAFFLEELALPLNDE
ncbi:MAG: LuxR family transcriptional regulator [Gammaproteobacteria bacterium]|nr:MAG: LuxR family transcriptional regulator [Gammaproteobacteria bacterium]